MTIKTQITFKDFWNFYLKNFFFKPLPIVAFIVIICYFIKELISAFQNNFKNWISLTVLLVIFLFVIFFGFKTYLTTKKAFNSNKKIQENNIYNFTTEKIHIKGETFESEFNWSSAYKLVEIKDWFLIYHSAQVMNMVPKKYFTKEQILEFRNIIKSTGVKAKLRKD